MKHNVKKILTMFIIVYILPFVSSCSSNNISYVGESTGEKQSIKVVEESENTEATTRPSEKKETENTEEHYNSYNISLSVEPATRLFSGVEKVVYKNTTKNSLKQIYFHLYLNDLGQYKNTTYFKNFKNEIFKYDDETGYMNINNVYVNNAEVKFTQNESILSLEMGNELKAGEQIEITLQFEGYVPKTVYKSGGNDEAIWCGDFFPILCRYEDNAWRLDEKCVVGEYSYSDIANYTVSVNTPKGYVVLGTGDEAVNESDSSRITTLSAKMVRNFFFAISKKYEIYTLQTANKVNVNICTYSNKDNVDFLLLMAQYAIDYYSDRLGSYPYEELDIIEAEYYLQGGVSYPAAILIDTEILKDVGNENIEALMLTIGQQWFYNVIGNDRINNSWLSEGLNKYMQQRLFYSKTLLEEKNKNDYKTLANKWESFSLKSMNVSLNEYKSYENYFYVQNIRAKLMFAELEKKLGKEKFEELIKRFYKEYSFKIAKPEDFIGLAEEIYEQDLTTFFDEWIQKRELPKLK